MKWTMLAIAMVACGILVVLWRTGGKESTPMLVVAIGLVLFFAILPLALSKKRSSRSTPLSRDTVRRETRQNDR